MAPTQAEHPSGVALASIWLALGFTPKHVTTLTGTNTLAFLTLPSSSGTKKKSDDNIGTRAPHMGKVKTSPNVVPKKLLAMNEVRSSSGIHLGPTL